MVKLDLTPATGAVQGNPTCLLGVSMVWESAKVGFDPRTGERISTTSKSLETSR
ncbi:hypothetical protein [Salinibacterium sp. TMP30]|uniref:hypothetical protein n=1 Tax=Salinibacterium sp. TMP30 TaxID=3138237 RepID=UPI003139EECE